MFALFLLVNDYLLYLSRVSLKLKKQTAEAVWKNYFLFLLINPVITVNKITTNT